MTRLALLRHGPTAWNEAGMLQGRRDLPLSPAGSRLVAAWRVPEDLRGCAWVTSPLRRAVETAALLGLGECPIEPRLTEMDWGEWEGHTLAELRETVPDMAAREAAGLDLSPPGGESPRQVQARLLPFLAETARRELPLGAVTHKGVIRAVYALASGWPMLGKPPDRLLAGTAQLFRLAADGMPRIVALNLPMATAR
jgi:probable phosphoglycerate mutase